MKDDVNVINGPRNRRSFLKTGLAAAGAVGTGFLARGTKAYAQQPGLTAGDVAILQFLADGEALEADFYTQYNELGGECAPSRSHHACKMEGSSGVCVTRYGNSSRMRANLPECFFLACACCDA